MKKLLLFSILAALPLAVLWGQQDPMFTKYMFNSIAYNPAYAGSQGYWDVNATFRKQWVGIEGAPATILAATEGPVAADRVGLGFTVFHDQLGVDRRIDLAGNYAYRIPLGNAKLAIGLKSGVALFQTDFSQLDVDPGDPLYQQDASTANPYIGAGAYLNSERYFVGFSAPTLVSIDLNGNDSIPAFLKNHLYFHAGGGIPLDAANMELRPSVLVSYQKAAPLQAHLSLTALFNKIIALGLSYRTGDALNFNVVVYPQPRFRIGAAYDFTLSELRNQSTATFELMVGYSFGNSLEKVESLRNL